MNCKSVLSVSAFEEEYPLLIFKLRKDSSLFVPVCHNKIRQHNRQRLLPYTTGMRRHSVHIKCSASFADDMEGIEFEYI
ncbi:hypothetical protein CEXT_197181 [Caerostris extrusa]|uniref:Uncharacterized protein n=1 Tax=Caerostris extrusa TaxID=172846 RepID=A0AAV4QUH5_CAEEX|nr:hypothetical protein CEXT_197181 [Caerostris extrusa]